MKKSEIKFEGIISERADVLISNNLNSVSRSIVCDMIKKNYFFFNDKPIKKCSFNLQNEGKIYYEEEKFNKYFSNSLKPWDNKKIIEIIHETEDYLIINKPINLSVHPSSNNLNKTLVNILLSMNVNLSKMNTNRPGIVHRLDKNTSGIIIIAKNDRFHDHIQKQFEDRSVEKKYLGLVSGKLKYKKGEINLPIGRDPKNRTRMKVINNKYSKDSKTIFKVIDNIKGNDLVEFNLITGRTHQIRVHMKHLGNPLLNDPDYGKQFNFEKGQYLQSSYISFKDLEGKIVSFQNNNFNIN